VGRGLAPGDQGRGAAVCGAAARALVSGGWGDYDRGPAPFRPSAGGRLPFRPPASVSAQFVTGPLPEGGAARLPEHETTYRRLRDLLLFGALAPGQKVTIQGLVADLGAGMTPVREAIRRLTAEGALEPHGNRRVSVPRLTAAQLDELAFARLAIEPELARRAAARITPDGIAALGRIDRQIDAAIAAGDLAGYLRGNFQFHFALYGAAGAPVLRGLAQALWLRSGPSLRVVIEAGGQIGPDRHREALSALAAADPAALADAIARDIRQGLDRIALAIVGPGGADGDARGGAAR